ncbi:MULTISPECIES: endolytic transglycosylase MltG [Methylobacterium]|uniref:Endolytic murein transglycosylase n=3 Tax=Pseudomonadota TaxID=1224 RepID=A0ABQ4SS60_9HYPH|nr:MULTISPECIES: endolytic transglycosylase MltG [Methylobacterium]PIU07703.1 MAG: endolytic transglycosylase MltG [Methylobacterium sp. CG09_land_8_20_14_0_10_71_15]PIU11406.1 MAG: endolytic transglycosylase MltG [Methylobacterium sp. CG08_land_8_20_14_0_20_71_15]GBU18583.1 aminodeoxychorismate lyase [Methylobacterium sp.]GJE05131.1 Endolytic murein transglycosylase [Methylobacterium jeotgali]
MFFRRRQTPEPTPTASDEPALPNRLSPRSPGEAIKPTAAPPPPDEPERRRGGLLATVSGLLTFAVVLALGAMIGLTIFHRQVREPGPLQADKVVVIPSRSGTAEIAEILQREGVIAHTGLFELAARFGGKAPLKAGEYNFKAHASINDAIDTVTTGRQVQHAVTFPEGLTSEQIVGRLNENDILTGEIGEIPPEGSLLPDTYKFERGATRQMIVNLMRAKQREVLNQIWLRRSPEIPVKTPAEMVTLASIVEKETGRADERPRVAGVFVNRLNKRMKLQSDPTIVYGLVGGRGTLGRGILRSEIERATPYNTYVIEGLPPGPIANPGRAALEAVANPSRTKDLFFVADGTGGHAFADSLEGHQRNVARWRQVERARQAPAPTDAASPTDKAEPDPSVPGSATAYAPDAGTGTPAAAPTPAAARPRAFDASEGTRLDPLKNKTYDLGSPKTVPVLKQP